MSLRSWADAACPLPAEVSAGCWKLLSTFSAAARCDCERALRFGARRGKNSCTQNVMLGVFAACLCLEDVYSRSMEQNAASWLKADDRAVLGHL